MKRIGIIALLLLCTTCANAGRNYRSGGTDVPAAASSVGYTTHTFASTFNTSTVDKGKTYTSGFQWYLTNAWGMNVPSDAITLNADGTLTTKYASTGTIASVGKIEASPYFVGTAFGCGAYMTAEMAFDYKTLYSPTGTPSFWTLDLSDILGRYTQWEGAPAGYDHFIELDITEFLTDQLTYPYSYASTMHDTYGIYGETCTGWCRVTKTTTISAPNKTEFNLYHRYAALWVPATDTTQGYVKFYFDDIYQGGFSWDKYTSQTPPPTKDTPWTLGVIDQDHLVMFLGSGPSTPMTVRSVDVWQGSGACNLTN